MDGISLLRGNGGALAGGFFFACFLLVSCGRSDHSVPQFDADRAYRDLERQCEFGPRVSGTSPHGIMVEWLVSRLKAYADTVEVDIFTVADAESGFPDFKNIIARFNPAKEPRILLCAHYDTRPVADNDPDPGKRSQPVVGANDGASGVAVLVELARLFAARRPDVGVDMVFFDGEDFGEKIEEMLLGSKRFASENKDYRPLFGLLLDMVGDRDLQIFKELYSIEGSPEVVKRVWDAAGEIGLESVFLPTPRYAVLDDHVPLLQVGIRCIDIIDFDYPYWHTSEDTPDKCSGASLKAVGDVLLRLVYEVEA